MSRRPSGNTMETDHWSMDLIITFTGEMEKQVGGRVLGIRSRQVNVSEFPMMSLPLGEFYFHLPLKWHFTPHNQMCRTQYKLNQRSRIHYFPPFPRMTSISSKDSISIPHRDRKRQFQSQLTASGADDSS